MTTRVAGALTVAVLAGACGPNAALVDEEFEDLGIFENSARVTPEQAARAALIVDSTKGYLPFAYTPDGCYARALYMSMELAGRRVPSSAQYLSGHLQPSPTVSWGWHVAPMVEVPGETERTILDPSLAPSGPVPLSEWVRRSNPRGSYVLEWTLGSVYYTESWSRRNSEATPVIESFSQLTPFKARDVSMACSTMYDYLGRERAGDLESKRALLLGRTRTLANRLYELAKLDGYLPGNALGCGTRSVPQCREVSASCTSASDCCSLLCTGGSCRPRPIDLLDGGSTAFDAGRPAFDGGTRDAGVRDGGTGDAGFRDGGSPDAGTHDAGTNDGTVLVSGVPVGRLSGAQGSQQAFTFHVPTDARTLRFELGGGSGDADLYVRHAAAPTTSVFDYRPYRSDSNEVVLPSPVRPGTWHLMVRGYSAYAGPRLVATYGR